MQKNYVHNRPYQNITASVCIYFNNTKKFIPTIYCFVNPLTLFCKFCYIFFFTDTSIVYTHNVTRYNLNLSLLEIASLNK